MPNNRQVNKLILDARQHPAAAVGAPAVLE
jgi:hypothetical protein